MSTSPGGLPPNPATAKGAAPPKPPVGNKAVKQDRHEHVPPGRLNLWAYQPDESRIRQQLGLSP
jgi:hypothetical protein